MQPVAVFTGTGATPGQARALLAAKCMVNHHRLHVVCRHADGRDGADRDGVLRPRRRRISPSPPGPARA